MRRVFLDHQSTTPVLPEVFAAMRPFFTDAFGSPASIHQLGLEARDALDRSREQVAAMINAASPDEILFTSGGTESANLAIKGTAFANQRRGRHLVVSATEHPAVLDTLEFLQQFGFHCTRVPVDAEGRVNPASVREAITRETILVSVHHVNHDIGTIEPISEISEITRERNVPLFVDAVASGGWLPIDVRTMGATFLSLSPHRFYGPKGVGVLYRQRKARLTSLIHGGVQEGGLRAGTENVPAIVGAGAAAGIAARDLSQNIAHTAELQTRLWNGLQSQITGLKLNGPALGPHRASHNLNVSFEGVEGEALALMLDTRGIAVATGPGCMSKSMKISPVLTAIGLPHLLAQSSLILSLGRDNSDDEIDHAVKTTARVVTELRRASPAWNEVPRAVGGSSIAPNAISDSPA